MAHRVAAAQTMKRTAGSKLVTATIFGTVGMVGMAGIYIPFIADKDLIRGMDEDGGSGGARQTATMLQQEIQKLQHEGILRQDADMEADADAKRQDFFQTTTTSVPPTTTTTQKRGMWQYFKK